MLSEPHLVLASFCRPRWLSDASAPAGFLFQAIARPPFSCEANGNFS